MGGGGGFSGYRTININTDLSESSAEAQSSRREIEINKFLEGLLNKINSRDTEAIQRHLSEIEKTLEKEIGGLEKILFGGSISKKTFIEGTSDVDALVLLDKTIGDCEIQGEASTPRRRSGGIRQIAEQGTKTRPSEKGGKGKNYEAIKIRQ